MVSSIAKYVVNIKSVHKSNAVKWIFTPYCMPKPIPFADLGLMLRISNMLRDARALTLRKLLNE